MRAEFIPVTRGPWNPPELATRVEWRPESSHPWWAIWANGSVAAMCRTVGEAQEALGFGGVERRG